MQTFLVILCFCFLSQVNSKSLSFGLRTNRWLEEITSLKEALISRGHQVSFLTNDSTKNNKDIIIYDRRMDVLTEDEGKHIVFLDTDMLLDIDVPSLTIPSPYFSDSSLDSTYSRLRNAILRLKYHLSKFSQRRKLTNQIMFSTTSFLLETSRPIPPWLIIIGPISRVRKESQWVDVNPIRREGNILHLVTCTLRRTMDDHIWKENNVKFVIVSSTACSKEERSILLENPLVIDIFDDVDLKTIVERKFIASSKIENDDIIFTFGDVSSVLSILRLGKIPLVFEHDFYSNQVAIALERKHLGGKINRFEDYPYLKVCRDNVKEAMTVLVSSPSENLGLERMVDMLEILAESGSSSSSLEHIFYADKPTWYEYWLIDVYIVYMIVMGAVFVLAGSLASGASSLFENR